ncbi:MULTISPECIES: class I SAM-dependent methyltransferase [Paenibacillus]|uniref:class I SAM-dependent methyltransferase n=1 Tax=Paenibacillus TaxID=44249 RepID=UPI0022B8A13B|nr:class I SAM-dependent methyltransferase [Paenibacillus caseinilyticus]MCZ8521826.1 class I SAM-dependent methyltransferase [Paenibacillus caseinilyticus]
MNDEEYAAAGSFGGSWWDAYCGFFSDEALWDQGSRRHLLKFVRNFAGEPAGRTLLDVGCGPGLGVRRYAAMGFRAGGVDLSPAMVEAAQASGLDVRLADGGSLPFESGSFAVTTACTVVEWVKRPLALLDEMKRVTAPGGAVIVACLGPRTLPHEDAYRRLRGEPTNYNMLLPVELHRMLDELGLPVGSMTGVRHPEVPAELYAQMDWVTRSYCSTLWIAGARVREGEPG